MTCNALHLEAALLVDVGEALPCELLHRNLALYAVFDTTGRGSNSPSGSMSLVRAEFVQQLPPCSVTQRREHRRIATYSRFALAFKGLLGHGLSRFLTVRPIHRRSYGMLRRGDGRECHQNRIL